MREGALIAASALLLLGGCAWNDPFFDDQGLEVAVLPEGDIEFRQKGKPLFAFRYAPKLPPGVPERFRRAGYVYPLFDAAGTDILDDFPKDHYHHRGISWMWPVVRIDGQRYDLWELKGIHQRFEAVEERGNISIHAWIRVRSGWYVGERRVVQETAGLGVIPELESEGDITTIFVLTLEATDRPVTLSGQPEGNKGYGGFGVRFAPHADQVITTSAGRLTEDTLHQRYTWVDFSARFRGSETVSGLTIIPHPSNEGEPNEWICRHYGYVGTCWPGLGEVTLEPGKPRTLAYLVIVHPGEVVPEDMDDRVRLFRNFGKAMEPEGK